MSDLRRRPAKGVRFEDARSASSRASTTGGSSTSSGHSGSQYSPEYNVGALEETLRKTVQELDGWKKKALEAEDAAERSRKSEESNKARIKALELSEKTLQGQLRDLQKDFEAMKKENSRSRKPDKHATQSPPSSPDTGKPRRSDSKRSKDTEADQQNERLKERMNRSGDSSSENSSTKPPSSSKSHRSSGRRLSVSSSHTERPHYSEGRRSAAAVSPTGSRRPEYLVASAPPVITHIQSPVYATTPRNTGIPVQSPLIMLPGVEYSAYSEPYLPDNGSYQAYPLPRRA
ncbi:unnamed protein product [Discula destructiva]